MADRTSHRHSDAVDRDGLYFDERAGWCVWSDCGECGGHRLALGVLDSNAASLARVRAASFAAFVRGRLCLGCRTREWRRAPVPAGGQAVRWWDTQTEEWMLQLPVPGMDVAVSLPLGVHSFWDQREAEAAARVLTAEAPLPLRVSARRDDVDPEVPTAFHDRELGQWLLWSPCARCGGVELDLGGVGRASVDQACARAQRCLERVAEEGCPGCIADAERVGPGGDDPRVFFDVELGEWLLWQPVDGLPDGVLLPLGIARFDVPDAVLQRAAAGVLLAGEALEGDDGWTEAS